MMSDENIESRLTAYLDNELPPTERAEIEKYLHDNPRQRQILQQLLQTRQLLADLDRAEAPEEILETIQSRLERGELLDEAIEEPRGSRSKKLTQTLLMAAILVLSVSLAAVIYRVISPRGQQSPDYSAIVSAPAQEPQMRLKSAATVDKNAPSSDAHLTTGPSPFWGIQRDNIYTQSDLAPTILARVRRLATSTTTTSTTTTTAATTFPATTQSATTTSTTQPE